ncbi:hypothetical protein ONZ45_g15631 [Pleurotus djamor]|nr:hypothetical protein ONZ45_g15631 [Pleurotus djamor]
MIQPDDKILIIGAGCFGLSTAYHLLQRGFTDVTVLDKAETLPAEDAASNDLNKVVRSSYDDIFYAKLAKDAIGMWKDTSVWGDSYHESGVLVLGIATDKDAYASRSYHNDVSIGSRVEVVENGDEIRNKGIFPPSVRTGDFDQFAGYLNRDCGWAYAGQAVSFLIDKIRQLNGKILSGKAVRTILRNSKEGRATGVECQDGSVYDDAALVVIATGAWTASAFPQLRLQDKLKATGQCLATIQLTEDEAQTYRECPVVLNYGNGFYMFPPNKDNIVKIAIHAAGYIHAPPTDDGVCISTPRTVSNAQEDGLRIPKEVLNELRAHLRIVYPDLAVKPILGTRMCWYTDSPDGDWIIGEVLGDPGIMLATAGSGHAFKGKLDASTVTRFSVARERTGFDASRSGQPKVLDLGQLCTKEDLL